MARPGPRPRPVASGAVRTRLAVLLVAVLALAACGDDGGSAGSTTAAPDTTAAVTDTSVVGPTSGTAACADLADRYVARARVLFETEGTPSDALVDRVRARLATFDEIALTAGCGQAYVVDVCDGLDELTEEGLLVIFPLLTAQCF